MKSQVWWYTARAGGTMAWALSAVSVVWGLLLSSRVLGKRISGPKLMDLHRFLGGLAVVFTGVHLAGLYLDSYVHFGIRELFVPFASQWQPNAVAWGIVAMYLLLAVEVTSLLRRRVGERVWRVTHYLGFAVFVLGTIHGLKAGTDVSNPVLWWPAAGLSAAIIGLSVARVSTNGDPVPAKTSVRRLTVDGATSGGLGAARDSTAGERATDREPELTPPPAFVPKPDPVPATIEVDDQVTPPVVSLLERTLEGLLNMDDTAQDDPAQSLWSAPVIESHRVPAEPLAVRTPNLHAATTEPATSLRGESSSTGRRGATGLSTVERTREGTDAESMRDESESTNPSRHAGPPPPPNEVDPVTGEPDPQAYRKWLKEWLAYVESQL